MSATLDPINGLVYVPQLLDLEVERYQQCGCCPYGYHIDLDFVRYCEALSHGNEVPTSKQKCRERRRQRHSMEVLLGLTSPSLWTIEQQLPEIPIEESPPVEKSNVIQDDIFQDALCKAVEVFEDTLQRTHKSHNAELNSVYSYDTVDGAFHGQWSRRKQGLDEVTDSESTMLRVTPVGNSASGKHRRRLGGSTETQTDQTYSSRENEASEATAQQDSDAASVGSATSGVSTLQIHPELQNIREQMAVSLERMRELEEQVKLIPILQIQLAILKEEKRVLIQKFQENGDENFKVDNKTKDEDGYVSSKSNDLSLDTEDMNKKDVVDKYNEDQLVNSEYKSQISLPSCISSQSCIEGTRVEPKSIKTSFRNRGITCSVVTRDVGVSHLHPKTRNTGTNTHESPKKLTFSGMRRENILPDLMLENVFKVDEMKYLTKSVNTTNLDSFKESESPLKLSDLKYSPITKKNISIITDLQMSDIQQCLKTSEEYSRRNANSTSTATQTVDFLKPVLHIVENSDFSVQVSEELLPTIQNEKQKNKKFNFINVGVQCDYKVMKHAGIQLDTGYWHSCKGIQYESGHWSKDMSIQVGQSEKHTLEVGVDVKPRTLECGVEAKVITREKSTSVSSEILCNKCNVPKTNIAVGQTEVREDKLPLISLSSLNDSVNNRNTNINREKTKTVTSSVACGPDWIFSTSRSTDTYDLICISRRDIGSNTIHKLFKDAAVSHTPDKLQNELNGDINCESSTNKEIAFAEPVNISQSRIPRLTGPVSPTIPTHVSIKYGLTTMSTAEKTQKTVSPTPPSNHPKSPNLGVPKVYSRKMTPTTNNMQEKIQDLGSNNRHTLQRQSTYTKLPEVTEIYAESVEIRSDTRAEPSKEMKAALKVLNDYFKKNPSKKDLPKHLTNASNIVQQEWFKISGGKAVNPLAVEDYLDYIESCSTELLEYVVNMTDISGNTALHYAVSSGNFDVVSILLDSKVCNVNKRNAAGYTCVMLATLVKLRCETHRQIIRRMFHLADVNIKAKPHGQTALMLATSHGNLEMVEMLTEAGADMNIQDADGSTALMCAADHGFIEIVKHIIAQPDCDVTLTDSDGCTALNIAMESGNRHVGFLLYAHEHFSQGNSPHGSLRSKRSRSSTPTSRNNTLPSGRSGGTPVPSDVDKTQP